MKRSELRKKKEEKSYPIKACEIYEVTFNRDHSRFKKGDKDHVSFPIAAKYARAGIIAPDTYLVDAAKEAKCEHLFEKGGKPNKKQKDL